MINHLGVLTLIKKEIYRFAKVYHQTILSPIVNIILFLLIFSISIGSHLQTIEGIDFAVFVASGLIIMSAMQNSFANSSSSLVMSKVMGHIVDYIIPPLSAFELLLAFTVSSIVRGLLVAFSGYLIISIFIDIAIYNMTNVLLFLFLGCFFLSLLGILCGILSDGFDQMSALTSYIITPLTFLSGTFYSTKSLPDFWQKLAHFNPFFYIIDGFRYGISGYKDSDIMIACYYLIILNFSLFIILLKMLKSGYRIKT
jgi:ABC-2 type transport system permease protein